MTVYYPYQPSEHIQIVMPSYNADWTIEFVFPGSSAVRMPLESEILVGRRAPEEKVFDGLDLNGFEGERQGVSRRHAVIRVENDIPMLVDLGSSNGTVLNTVRLKPNQGLALNPENEVYFGHLRGKLNISSNLGKSSILAMRNKLSLSTAPRSGRGQRILIVEDEPSVSEMMRVALARGGFSTVFVKNVVSAINALKSPNPPVLIIADIMLPSVRGTELPRFVRREEGMESIPVIMMSALNDGKTVTEAIEAGADVFVEKPVNLRELLRVISALLRQVEQNKPAFKTTKLGATGTLSEATESTESTGGLAYQDSFVAFVEGGKNPISFTVSTRVSLGRSNPEATEKHIDLEPFDALNQGVSRIHAYIQRQGDKYELVDAGSSNGTFVNGVRLKKDEYVPLTNGIKIRFGKMKMELYILSQNGDSPTAAPNT